MAFPKVIRWGKKKKAGTDTWCGQSASDLPYKKIDSLDPDIYASYAGPDKGLAWVAQLDRQANNVNSNATPNSSRWAALTAGAQSWAVKSRKAYGICMSLYDQHPINGKISGDPIADSFAVCARKNNALLIVADGVNWGEKSKMAARCAIYGCMKFMNQKLFHCDRRIKTTHEAFDLLLHSLDLAHEEILRHEGGLTTLCVALILPLRDCKQYVVCIVNVGDSLAFVFSKHHGAREITTGSHDIQSERDIRDAGGALGPVNGRDPELHNLTCSMTFVDPGDIVFLTTDGISDNFDPVVTKMAVAKRRHSDSGGEVAAAAAAEGGENPSECGVKDGKPEMQPQERHQYAVKEMERIIHEFELFTESPCSAQELCGALLQHVLKLTDPKRKVLENPELFGKKLKSKDRKRRDTEIVSKLSMSPGKLDHASIVGYEVGYYHGNDDEDYEDEGEDEMNALLSGVVNRENNAAPQSPSNQSLQSRPHCHIQHLSHRTQNSSSSTANHKDIIMDKTYNVPEQNVRDWSSGALGCASDCKSCICGCLCLPCLTCQVSQRLDESCIVGCCVPGGVLALRTKLRTLYGISGSICGDCATIICCAPCVVCQLDRELTAMGL